jgi:transposase
MTAWRQVLALTIEDEDLSRSTAIARSRTEPAGRVERARMLLAYREDPSFFAVCRALGVHHQTVQRCVERAVAYGPLTALDDRPRPGKEPKITAEAKAWLVDLACRKAKELGYPHELWTTRLLVRHAREDGPAAGHDCLASLVQGTVCKILNRQEIKPKETKAWLAAQPAGRFAFTFTPKHGSWLNLIEGFFSKLARSVLRHIHVASKQELTDRIMAAIDDVNRHPVVHTWSYKLNKAA